MFFIILSGRGIGSVSWSMDVSPPRSRKRPRQGVRVRKPIHFMTRN